MARLHLRYKNIKAATITATRELFDDGPWTGSDDDRHIKYERWVRKVSEVYGIPAPTLEICMEPTVTRRRPRSAYEWGRITLASWSVTNLFHTFRHHMQAMGATTCEMDDCEDAQAWACSLFYTVRPRQFRRRVREGRIFGVRPDDLLTRETLSQRMDEMYDDNLGIEWDPDGGHDNLRPDEDEEENVPAPVRVHGTVGGAAIVDSAWIQQRYGVSRSFVSNHAERMNGWRDGGPRWKFREFDVERYMTARNTAQRA